MTDTRIRNSECLANLTAKRVRHVKRCRYSNKLAFLGGVVTVAMANTQKPQLRVCEEFNCELFEANEKCAQIF